MYMALAAMALSELTADDLIALRSKTLPGIAVEVRAEGIARLHARRPGAGRSRSPLAQ
jgi:hypothetical protein